MDELTNLLEAAAGGDREAFDRAYALVYEELRGLAHAQRARWRGQETLNTTALVHETYLKLAAWTGAEWEGRGHLLGMASRAMRQVLVSYAERWRAAKRGGDRTRVPLSSGLLPEVAADAAVETLAVHRALERLEAIDPRQVRVVECRFFAGLSIPETAEAVGVSPATVKRDWRLASAWLHRELAGRAELGTEDRP